MASKEFLAFGPDGTIMSLDGKLVRKHGTIVDAAMLAAIRATLGVPAAAEGLVPSQNLNDVADKQVSRDNLSLLTAEEISQRTNARQPANAMGFFDNGYLHLGSTPSPGNYERFTGIISIRFNKIPTETVICLMNTFSGTAQSSTNGGIFINTDGTLGANFYDGAFKIIGDILSGAVDLGRTYRIAYRYDQANDGLAIFVEGKKVGTIAVGLPTGQSLRWQIGVSDRDTSCFEVVAFTPYNISLTDGEIAQDAESQRVPKKYQWGGAQVDSDFSAGVDSWTAYLGVAAGNIDSIGGQNDNLRYTVDAGDSSSHWLQYPSLVVGQLYEIELDFYIPSSNSHIDGLRFLNEATELDREGSPALDTWVTKKVARFTASTTRFRVAAMDGNTTGVNDSGGDDVFYIRNVKIRPIGAFADYRPDHLRPGGQWVDPSSNSLDATGTNAKAVNMPAFHGLKAVSQSANDIVELIQDSEGNTLRRMEADGRQKGVHTRQVTSGKGYSDIVEVSLADGATVEISSLIPGGLPYGFITVTNSAGAASGTCRVAFRGTASAPVLVDDPFNHASAAKDTASRLNFYAEGTDSNKPYMQNNLGATANLTLRCELHYLA